MADEQVEAPDEVWKPIPDHPDYEVSNLGRVRSVDRWIIVQCGRYRGTRRFLRGKLLRQFTLWNGYRTTHLGSFHQNKYVHILVARAFLGEPPEGMETCHNDGIKPNCTLQNLRYDTRQGNVDDRVKHRDAKNSIQSGFS